MHAQPSLGDRGREGTLDSLGAFRVRLERVDVVEAPSRIDRSGAKPVPFGLVPESVRGLVVAVKQYERLAIRAAVEGSPDLARLALLANPIVNDWDAAGELLGALLAGDERHLGYLAA